MKAIFLAGDAHINSTVGLCPPVVVLDDGDEHRLSKGQKWLWNSWLEACDWFADLSKGADEIAVFNGDWGECDSKRRSHQIITRNKATILKMMYEASRPIVERVDRVYVNRGTEAHVGKSAELEESFASDLTNKVKAPDDKASWWHLQLVAEGVRMDIAHHASMGSKPWTEKNAANALAIETMNWYGERGQKAPHLVIRSHMHRRADSYDNYFTRAIFLPAWQLFSSYIHRVGQGSRIAQIGATAILCDNGEYEVKKLNFEPDRSKSIWIMQA